MNLKKSAIFLATLSVLLFSMCSVLSLYAMYRISEKSNNAVIESQRIEHVLVEASKAQASFQQQIQEFKNILLRASNDDVYKKHLDAFKAQHDLVQANLDSASKAMTEAGIDNADAEKLIIDHSEIKFKLIEAAKSVRFVGISASEAADQQAAGIDVPVQDALNTMRSKIDQVAAERSEKRKSEINALGDELILLLSVGSGVGVLLFLVVFFAGIRKLFTILGAEPSVIKDTFEKISSGDLTVHIHGNRDSVYGAIGVMQEKLRTAIRNVIRSSEEVMNQTVSVQKDTVSVDEIARAQLKEAGEVVGEMANIENDVMTIEKLAQSTQNTSSNVMIASEEGERVSRQASDDINELNNIIREAVNKFQILDVISQKISTAASSIKDISEKTNLLALNAAIEAARAGDAGRGFAVVADEVRKLSETTRSTTDEISKMVGEIHTGTRSIIENMDHIKPATERCIHSIEASSMTLKDIRDGSKRSFDAMNEVIEAISVHNKRSKRLSDSLNGFQVSALQTASSMEKNKKSADILKETSEDLRKEVSEFIV